MKSPCRNEENMIRANHAVAAVNRSSFDDRKDISLYAFPADIWSMTTLTTRNLVYLIKKNDSVLFDPFNSNPSDLVHVDELLFFFLNEVVNGLRHLHLSLFSLLPKNVWKDIFK